MKSFMNSKSNGKEIGVKWIFQFIKFGVVGISNTLISLIIYYLLLYFKINYIVANTVGFVISVINAYYWNNRFVFRKSEKGHIKPFFKTFLSYGITFIWSTIALFIMVNYLGISRLIGPIINLFITIPLNFILNKFWAFK